MADSKSPAIGKRWETSIGHERKQRNEFLEKEKQHFQEEVYSNARQALPVDNHVSGPSQRQTSINRNDRKNVGKQCLEGAKTKVGQPAPLPTPPNSPTASKIIALRPNGQDQHNIEKCRNDINELQASIDWLQSKLRESETECQRLREERRQASRLRHDSIHKDDEEEIERLKKRVKWLDEMLAEKEENIESLHKEIIEIKKSKRQLEIQLAEAESTVQERDRPSKEIQNATGAREVTSQEGSTFQTGRGSDRRREESKLQGKDWVIHCPKGRRKSGLSIARDVVRLNPTLKKP
jgi:uncharacterized coiled-coil DUF342 family protein